jgi:FlaA1/EpsC-like NDP-sugar epimerase
MNAASADPVGRLARDYLRGKRVMVTGVCGTIGQRLALHLLGDFGIAALVGLDNNESGLASLEERHTGRPNARFLLGDVRDPGVMARESRTVDVLFHAAAYKHVYLCERSPLEAIQTNVLGLRSLAKNPHRVLLQVYVNAHSRGAADPAHRGAREGGPEDLYPGTEIPAAGAGQGLCGMPGGQVLADVRDGCRP